jgi:hypothetical protein
MRARVLVVAYGIEKPYALFASLASAGGTFAIAMGTGCTLRRSGCGGGYGRAGAFVLGALLVAACGSSEGRRAPPTTWSYGIDFQSKDAAVSVDTLEISLFDASAGGCAELVAMRRSDADLSPIARVDSVALCDVLGDHAGALTGPYEAVSVLVVAKKAGKELLIGCAAQAAAPMEGDVPVVTLTNFDDTVIIMPSACKSVAAYCAHAC